MTQVSGSSSMVVQAATVFLSAVLVTGIAISNASAQARWKPERNVEFIVPATPGSLLDIIARRIQAIWQTKRLVEMPVIAVNKPGGSQTIAIDYMLNQRAGDGHYLEIFATTLFSSLDFHATEFT